MSRVSLPETMAIEACTWLQEFVKKIKMKVEDGKLTAGRQGNPKVNRPSPPADEVSSKPHPRFDDLYEYYDPDDEPLPQRQQQTLTPTSQTRPQSSLSSGVRSLRRTPRLQERDTRPVVTVRSRTSTPALRASFRRKSPRAQSDTPPLRFDESGSTTPQDFQRLVRSQTFWPKRTTRITRNTHDAIVFALEAIRAGGGTTPKPLTADLLEEQARMSDLLRGNPPGPAARSARPQNGGAVRTTAAGESGPIPTGPPRYRTPTDVMRDRRAREARRAEEAARQRQTQEEDERRRLQERVVGVGDDSTRRPPRNPPNPSTQSYNIAGPSVPPGSSSRRPENQPPDSTNPPTRPRESTGPTRVISANTQRNRTEAYEQLNVPAPTTGQPSVGRPDQPSQTQNPPQMRAPPAATALPTQATSQPAPSAPQASAGQSRNRFPNAFDRWEDLSSHWEGIVSSFLRKLENNEDELASKPIDRQMARQIDDLSAAGANLFHAVVELQRLRASSERKFQRWFFETRHEQEQAQLRQEELERQLTAEREARTHSSTSIEAARADRTRAEELVKEMRRELQISKEEARRAWEELGRREQEERERTIALRSGEPTLIGGVQVVPMQGLPSRQVSTAKRPQTRDGPTAGAGPGTLSGSGAGYPQQLPLPHRPPSRSQTTTTSLDSPGEESRQFTYQGETGTSPTVTDPYTEGSRRREPQNPQQLRHEPDTQFYSSPSRHQESPLQPPTSAAAIAAARAVAATSHPPLPAPIRSGTGGTDRSYIPSTASAFSEEEYHINPDGSYTRDDQGRRIPYHQPIRGPPGSSALSGEEGEMTEEEEEEDDDDDHAADIERERMYAAQYRQPQQPPITLPATSMSQTQSSSRLPPATGSGGLPSIPQGRPVNTSSDEYSSPSQQSGSDAYNAPPGWENIQMQTSHRHPTRLSDIIEEQTARTSPSRTSYISGGGLPGDGMPPSTVAGTGTGRR
ncbi:hypothetical protein LTR84_007481 [Exophiala bonariae]|uniref:Uncharacterized protein n=1 Tax=Exophiala bonariae TaxID=1690606 RepID=A0AAV9MZK0_9EURO|nr:hypothetical protein LTR84_007481 [Exophiala bonariae]